MTLKDKSLAQSTVMKVNHRLKRLGRDRVEQDKTIDSLHAEIRGLDEVAAQEVKGVLSARDDENELVLRFVEAKLLHELLCDELSALDDEIVQTRRDITALGGDLQVKDRTRSRLLAVEEQRLNELNASKQHVSLCHQQAEDVASALRDVRRQRAAITHNVAEQSINLSAMEERLHSIRASVAEAVVDQH